MKFILPVLAFFAATNSYAVMPFTISGDKISAIFSNEQLWRRLGSEVETIVNKVTGTDFTACPHSAGNP